MGNLREIIFKCHVLWIVSVYTGWHAPQIKDKVTTIRKPSSNMVQVPITVICGMENPSTGEVGCSPESEADFPLDSWWNHIRKFPQEWWVLMKRHNGNISRTASGCKIVCALITASEINRHHDKRPSRRTRKTDANSLVHRLRLRPIFFIFHAFCDSVIFFIYNFQKYQCIAYK